MIETISDLLKALADTENQKLKELDITHPPTIGCMYEGLTATILNKSLFAGLNLVIGKSCFIKGCHTEFDIILADGEGDPIPFTNKYTFNPQQVLAVIQVKKTLYSKDLRDSYENLMRIPDIYVSVPPEDYMMRIATDSIHHTLRKSVKDYNNGLLTIEEEYVYHTLVTQAQLPVTIAIGYNGFKTEHSLRESFIDYLNDKISTPTNRHKRYGPNNFPSLVICGNNSIIKLAGTPFNSPIREGEEWWDFTGSSHYNPMYYFLESIWTKLSYKYGLPPDIFGEDLFTPKITPFLSCKVRRTEEGMIGWEYLYHGHTHKDLNSINGSVEWQPVFLNEIQYRIMNCLLVDGELEFNKIPKLQTDAVNFGYQSLETLIKSLCDTGLVAQDGNKLVLITNKCQVLMIGKHFIAADNNSGRLDNWLMKHFRELTE